MRLNTIFLCTFWISIQVSSDAVMLIFPVASEIGLDLASIILLSLFLVGATPSIDCLCCSVGFFVFCCKSVVGVLTGLLSFWFVILFRRPSFSNVEFSRIYDTLGCLRFRSLILRFSHSFFCFGSRKTLVLFSFELTLSFLSSLSSVSIRCFSLFGKG